MDANYTSFSVFAHQVVACQDSSRYFLVVRPNKDGLQPTYLGIAFSERESSSSFISLIGDYRSPPENTTVPKSGSLTSSQANVSTPPNLDSAIKYYKVNHLEEWEKIGDGFYDPGRMPSPAPEKLPSLEEVRKSTATREVILINRQDDPKLERIFKIAKNLVTRFPTNETKIRILALHVANMLGGSGSDAVTLSIADLTEIKKRLKSNVVPIGEITHGTERHRALLFKYLCDNLSPSIPCVLTRHSQYNPEEGTSTLSFKAIHDDVINLVPSGSDIYHMKIVDLFEDPGRLRSLKSKVGGGGGGGGGASPQTPVNKDRPRSSFPARRHTEALKHHPTFRRLDLPDLLNEPLMYYEKLGQGAYGSVYRCSIGPVICAAKVYQKGSISPQVESNLLRESKILTNLHHPNIVRCVGYENSDAQFLIFFEYCSQGTLWDLMYRHRIQSLPFTLHEICHYALNVASGLEYLHFRNVFHRDIKSANILIDGDPNNEPLCVVKLTDFGLSTHQLANSAAVGTLEYMAPEIIKGQSSFDWAKADVWSFGMLLVELVILDAPYVGLSEESKSQHIQAGKMPSEFPEDTPAWPLISKCVVTDATKRSSAKDLIQTILTLMPQQPEVPK
eukprot:TRINITY_DN986_c0_g5_i1.p1 TRINITY_DN986_c0_g5~~TRINITY_DN986_c0_g5_i1.p1  ORF type:complete len:679 (+),score=120.09 TRINITY_DN986_c0_g5_i1:186-2039(+)